VIDRARALLAGAQRICVFSGAGLSAESGVPTFRDAATDGLWIHHDPMQLASPQGFADDPETVLAWYAWRRQRVAAAQPNPAHEALGRADVVNVTQNVDDLLARAGAADVIALHGTLTHDRCHAACGHRERVDLAAPPASLRACPACGAPMRPDVVWFGETLPPDAWARGQAACTSCDVLLVVGTAAEVYPAAGLIDLAKSSGAAVIVVNTNPSAASAAAEVEVIGRAGAVLPEILR
jgi:NAD-dependent deacetylase